MNYKTYKKSFDHSYAVGFFPVLDLLKYRPETALAICVSSGIPQDRKEQLLGYCDKYNIRMEVNDKVTSKIGGGNIHVLAVFRKANYELGPSKSHIVLVNPSDMGNLGNILRTMASFDFRDLAIITPAADVFSPKVVRSSMGAFFSCNVQMFPSLAEYKEKFSQHDLYAFALDKSAKPLKDTEFKSPYSLVFGCETSGLSKEDQGMGLTVLIEQSDGMESLNLATSAGIAMYEASTRDA